MTTPTSTPLTAGQYIAEDGAVCPFCTSTNIEAGSPEFDGIYCLVGVECLDCGREWSDEYRLSGYSYE